MTTKYLVTRTEQDSTLTLVATKAKKQDAIALANADRDENRRTVTVTTEKGTEVYVVKGVRPMAITPRYTRTVEVPEGVTLPEGARLAYKRSKHDALILAFDGAEGEKPEYAIQRISTGKVLKNRFAKTREAGAFVLTLEVPVKA